MSEFQPRNPFDEQELPVDEQPFAGPDLDEEMRLGQAARFLIDSEPYKLAIAAMQEQIHLGFRQVPLRDTEGLVHLRMMQHCVESIHEILETTAETGKLAAIQLTERQQRATHDGASPTSDHSEHD